MSNEAQELTVVRRRRRTGPYNAGKRRRAQIIEEAMTVFSAVGFHRATMQQIADACGVTRTGLGHHFTSKDELLEAVLAERDIRNFEFMHRTGMDPEVDGLDYFSQLVQVVARNAEIPGIVNLWAALSSEAADPEHPAHDWFIHRYDSTRATMAVALDQLRATGRLRSEVDSAVLAVEIVAFMDGLQVQWLYDRERIDMQGQLRRRLEEIIGTPIP